MSDAKLQNYTIEQLKGEVVYLTEQLDKAFQECFRRGIRVDMDTYETREVQSSAPQQHFGVMGFWKRKEV